MVFMLCFSRNGAARRSLSGSAKMTLQPESVTANLHATGYSGGSGLGAAEEEEGFWVRTTKKKAAEQQ
jgi:hypothetical protein